MTSQSDGRTFDPPSNARTYESSLWRVLVVEDHPDLAAVTAELLKDEGLDVRTALSGREALKAAPAFRPHLILCDMRLPDMEGLELVRRLRSDPATQGSCVVILTAMWIVEAAYRKEVERLGVDAFISKPITKEAVRTLVAKLTR
jgi:CheY-like chemotaxis protein